MLEGTFSFIKELLGFSSVNTAEYDIERVKDTAGPGGRIYCLTNRGNRQASKYLRPSARQHF